MTVDVWVECSGTAMFQLDHFHPRELLPHPPASAPPRVELELPHREHPISQTVLQRFELRLELWVKQRHNAERLWRVDCPVQNEVGIRRTKLPATPFTGQRIAAVDPDAQLILLKVVDCGSPVFNDKARDSARAGGVIVERTDPLSDTCSIALSLERIGHRRANAMRIDAALPSLKTSAHGPTLH